MTIPEIIKPERRDWLPMVVFAVGLLVQSGGTVWWFSSINSRVGEVEKDVADAKVERAALSAQIDIMQKSQADAVAFMGRMDERMMAQGATLARIERLLESGNGGR